ncbi:MAG: hypothetical protein IK096_01515 [Lachnospiraceae bacterium]|nr:hypothetical protein [Lachnospiraceae bacterium]
MKGIYGNIRSRRRSAVIRTAVLAGFSVGLFLLGLFLYHSNKNLLSVIAALGAIPSGLSAVNMILFLKAKPLSKEAYETIEQHRGKLLIRYELEMTSYDRTWHIGAACALQKNICLFTEEAGADLNACEKHIREQLKIGGYEDVTVKVFGDLSGFCQRLDQLEKLRDTMHLNPAAIEDAWQPGTTQTPAGILLSISL